MEKTAAPVSAAIIGAIGNIGLAFLFVHTWGLLGLVSAFSISAIVQCALLWALLRVQAGPLGGRDLVKSLIKSTAAAVAMAVAVQAAKYGLVHVFPLTTFLGVLIQLLGASAAGMGVYVGASLLMRSEECKTMLAGVRAKMLRSATPKEIPSVGA